MIIYCTTNLINGKKYIGKDADNDSSYLGSGLLLSKAIKKYGKANFKKQVIQDGLTSLEDLSEAEKYWIDYFSAAKSPLFYNLTLGGTGGDTSNSPNWLERNRKISEKLKVSNLNHFVSDETRLKESLAKKGKKRCPIAVEKTRQKLTGVSHWTEERRVEQSVRMAEKANKNKGINVTCPTCSRILHAGPRTIWHINNCALKSQAE